MADKDEPPPQVGATFLPGGLDDFYMPAHAPDLVSPVPQRIMHELPGQMSDRLELDATSPSVAVGSQQQLNTAESRTTSNTPHVSLPQAQMQTQTTPLPIMVASNTTSQLLPLQDPASGKYHQQHSKPTPADEPRFAAFPKLHHTPGHVPEADEDHEAALGRARPAVLISTDPEMQLAWAQDALRYVDIVLEHDIRMAALGQPKTAGKTVYELRNDAMSIVDFLADQSHPKADFLRGTWLEFGKFEHREDKVEAFRCYKRSAAKGYARSEYRMGMQFESTSEAMKALQHYQAGEALGDAASCYRLGMMTLLGQLGQAQDYGKGLRLIRNAADGADENAPQGAYVYGMLLARELPQIKIPEIFLAFDIVSARQYIEKSAFLGFSRAMVKMGSAYELCLLGCDFNPTLSLHYNALAALRGETEAEMAISKWFLCGYEGLFHKNEEMAFWYARRAADSGLATAEFAMGYYFEVGVYVPTSVSKALDWYSKAASQGNKDAQDRIAGINSSQTLSKKDHQNVAVSRIQSQYGSRRGNRPERFGRPVQQLADIPDESLQVHRPATVGLPAPAPALPAVSQAFQFRPPTAASQRSQTVTPYPVDDRPPSVAPYPLDDGPPVGRIVPVGGTYAANRPSEIQNGPNTYSAPGPGRGQFLDPAVGRRPLPVNTPIRPHSSAGTPINSPGNRLDSAHRTDRYQVQPLPIRTQASNGVVQPIRSGLNNNGSPYPRIDPKRPPAGSGPSPRMSSVRPPPPPSDTGSRIPVQPIASPEPKRASQDHVMSGAIPASKLSTSSGKPPVQNSGIAPPVAATTSMAPRPSKPPGSGPKTFEEMGVPAGKQDHDCVSKTCVRAIRELFAD